MNHSIQHTCFFFFFSFLRTILSRLLLRTCGKNPSVSFLPRWLAYVLIAFNLHSLFKREEKCSLFIPTCHDPDPIGCVLCSGDNCCSSHSSGTKQMRSRVVSTMEGGTRPLGTLYAANTRVLQISKKEGDVHLPTLVVHVPVLESGRSL